MPRREVTICLGQIEWEITEGVEKFTLDPVYVWEEGMIQEQGET